VRGAPLFGRAAFSDREALNRPVRDTVAYRRGRRFCCLYEGSRGRIKDAEFTAIGVAIPTGASAFVTCLHEQRREIGRHQVSCGMIDLARARMRRVRGSGE
jgi:hypothetical protein